MYPTRYIIRKNYIPQPLKGHFLISLPTIGGINSGEFSPYPPNSYFAYFRYFVGKGEPDGEGTLT